MTTLLRIDSSARTDGSVTRRLVDTYVETRQAGGGVDVVTRDVSAGLPFLDASWVNANFTPEDERTDEQRDTLALSDALIAELEAADEIVIGLPIYNFGVPSTLKAWIDLVARARKTFRYTEVGPVGLLTGKRATILVASGGTEVGSAIDFATPYLRHVLGFIGIHDVTVIAADQLGRGADEKVNAARTEIGERIAVLTA